MRHVRSRVQVEAKRRERGIWEAAHISDTIPRDGLPPIKDELLQVRRALLVSQHLHGRASLACVRLPNVDSRLFILDRRPHLPDTVLGAEVPLGEEEEDARALCDVLLEVTNVRKIVDI